MHNTGIIILAAGASQRLGTPKQQLLFENKSLLQRIIHTATQTGCSPVIVVLGAYAARISTSITGEPVTIVFNEHWETGMASSIQTGMHALLRISHTVSNVLLLLCDQPFISTALLQQLLHEKNNGKKNIIACSYDNTIGTPVLFDQQYFPQLLSLTGQEGAKKIIQQHIGATATIDFPQGNVDIDTSSDYLQLLQPPQ